MAKKFDRIPEDNGAILDNTLVGGMANNLRMGRYIEYPKYRETEHRTMANL